MLSIADISAAQHRIQGLVKTTPIVQSSLLNQWLGHQIIFKAECLQTTGAFKLRGALNTLLKLKENGKLPARIVANSSGNHAQAVSYAARLLGIPATIYTTKSVSAVKAAASEYYGAIIKRFDTRIQADAAVKRDAQQQDCLWLPPFNHADVIAGQGTLTLEALGQAGDVDAVFAPCGGGGLLSGALIAARAVSPKSKVIGAEPLAANDAARSLAGGKIVTLQQPPKTLADGAATPAVGDITFEFLKQLDGFYEVDEQQIAYWTQWLHHLLKLHIEPTCAMTMSAVCRWLAKQSSPQKVLVLISGGNIDQQKMQQIWSQDHLANVPRLEAGE